MACSKLFIDGKWQSSTGSTTIDVINPAYESIIARIPLATKQDVNKAVLSAKNAFFNSPEIWWRTTGKERAVYLTKISKLITKRTQMLAKLETEDCGKPFEESIWDMGDASSCFQYYANLAEELDSKQGEIIKIPDSDYESRLYWDPMGVAALIIPWNYPMLMAAWKVAPALAAGCCCILKPSELTPRTAMELAKITEEIGLPAGVFNVVTGDGITTGEALVNHPDVDKIAFTGSTVTGSRIMSRASVNTTNITLELGGKSPIIVFGDINMNNLDKIVEWIMFGCFLNSGQVCSGTSRLLVQRSVAAKLLKHLVQATKQINICSPDKKGCRLGPLVSSIQYKKVMSYISSGINQGATLLTGGKRPDKFKNSKGYWVEPTIFSDVSADMTIWKEEIFGPVLSVMVFDSEDEAVKLANDSSYGLASAIITGSEDRYDRITPFMRSGIVWHNCSQPCFVEAPWGGFKRSGIGRELGRFGLHNFLQPKQVTKYVATKPLGWYNTNSISNQ